MAADYADDARLPTGEELDFFVLLLAVVLQLAIFLVARFTHVLPATAPAASRPQQPPLNRGQRRIRRSPGS